MTPEMETLVALGRTVAPFALECAVKISVAALAALLATRVLGRRRPARAFAFIVAAFALGTWLLFSGRQVGTEDPLPGRPYSERVLAPGSPAEGDAPVATATPGLVAKYGSMFQVRFSGNFPREAAAPASPPGPARGAWLGALGLAWLLGFGAVNARHLLGILAIRVSLSRSRPCEDRRLLHRAASLCGDLDIGNVELRLSPGTRVAFLVGVARPTIILPEEAAAWTEERIASTLLHECLHVKRHDIAIAEAIRFLASLAWFSPLPWLALSSALELREEACDEAVLRAGIAPARYAASLLASARAMARTARRPATAAINGGSRLERRIRHVLEGPPLRSSRDGYLRSASAAMVLAAAVAAVPLAAPVYSFPDAPARATPAPGEWPAVPDPLTSRPGESGARGVFSISRGGGFSKIRLRFAGRTSTCRLPSVAMPGGLPLTARARMILPFGDLLDAHSRRPFLNPGWSIWDDRGIPVTAAGAGRVVVAHIDSRYGPIVEVDHGSGLRTRYCFGRHGAGAVQAGEFVAAGTVLGTFGEFSASDLPCLNFGVLLQAGGKLVALDPAPFLFAAEANRKTPLGASVVNASIRIEDRAEVRRLVARGVSVNCASADGTLPLEWAVMTQNLDIARDLVAAGADPLAATWDVHQAHIALHGPSVAEIARGSSNPELIALLGSDSPDGPRPIASPRRTAPLRPWAPRTSR